MKRKIAAILASMTLAGAAFAAAQFQKVKYEMYGCPSASQTGFEDNYIPNCAAPNSNCSQGTCTGTAPTGQYEGLNLLELDAYRLTVCGPKYFVYTDGGTVIYSDGGAHVTTTYLSGAGTMQAWYYHGLTGQWTRDPTLDKDISVTSTSCAGGPCSCETFPDDAVGGQFDRVKFVPSGVTVHLTDGGTNDAGLSVLLDGHQKPTGFGY